jgi:hypothetical protein
VTHRRPSPPTHGDILRYWLEDSPWRQQLIRHFDGNEPCCFACRTGLDAWTHTERAHLIAHAHGGPSTPDNLVLLCGLCHATMDILLGEKACPPDMKLTWIVHHPGWDAIRLPHLLAAGGIAADWSYRVPTLESDPT